MAKRTVNRKELRAQAEAAEARDKAKAAKGEAKAKPAKAKKEKAPKPEKPAKEKKEKAPKKPSKKKVAKEARMKAFWGVFNQGMKKLVTFEYADKRAAEKKASELGPNHFVQLVKEAITE
jgi:hypothetical protein